MEYIKHFKSVDSIVNNIPDDNEILLLGESTHGTKEFYETRANITKNLVKNNNYNVILFESDWFNMYSINKYINHSSDKTIQKLMNSFKYFPVWMWKNNIIKDLIEWLKEYTKISKKKVYLLGLDCYLLLESLEWIYTFLELIDIELYKKIKIDLTFIKKYKKTEDLIFDIMSNKLPMNDECFEEYFQNLLIIIQNNTEKYKKICLEKNIDIFSVISVEICCDVIINSYEYFKKQYIEPSGSNASWNARDQHMLMTTMKLKDNIKDAKIIIWAHNSHIGDATATENGGTTFANNNTWNLGQMCRAMFLNTYIIGFGTYNGSVTAAQEWNKKSEIFVLNIPIEDSIENIIYKLCKTKNINDCFINLEKCKYEPFNILKKQRMIGVIYNSNNELQSHYVGSILSKQYNLYIFISHTEHLVK